MSVKWIEPGRPRVIRYIRLRRVGHEDEVLVGAIVGAAALSETQCNRSDGPSETGPRDLSASDASKLLLKELEETNNWARLVLQLYFGWFALQFTVNGVAMGWLFTRTATLPWFSSLIFLVFVGWNLMGTIGTVMVYKGLAAGDERMKQVIGATASINQSGQDSWLRPQSAMPQGAISTVFTFCVLTMFISLAFWIVMFVVGR